MRVDLTDPELFGQNRAHEVLAWLRANAPVYRHPEPDGPGFWVLTRHRDILSVYSDADTFSSRYGMRLGSDAAAVGDVAQRMLIVTDPPDHAQLKKVMVRPLGPGGIAELERSVRTVVREVVDDAMDRGEFDFIEVIAKRIPNRVVCAMMGIPRQDWEWLGSMTTDAFDADDEAVRGAAHGEIFLYFADLLDQRRGGDGDDFITRIANDTRDDGDRRRPLTDEEVVFNCNGVLSGANETTRYSAAGGVLAMAENPAEWRALVAGGEPLVADAVEEILRWTTPGVHALRTVTRPTVIGDVELAVDDRVTLWNLSANRDEDVFADPFRFDVERRPRKHLTFGHGPHICLGARLARLELTVLFGELRRRIDSIELAGTPDWNSSNFTWGLRSLPVRFVAAKVPATA